MAAAKNQPTISQMRSELNDLLAWFESDAVNVEEAIVKYEAALKLAKELEVALEQAKNKVEVIKQNFAK